MGRAVETEGFYQRYGKRAIDIALSSIGLVAISPLLGATALAIKLDSPGPVLFKQKRVGKNKELFEIYKFRSMRSDTPADVPTHQLGDPSARITKVGAFIRRTSIDELPQLVNILKGDMSFVGPRPALWNQYDLIEERDRYGANDVVPGLTGWAQINGRDELEIPVKARYDGEYAADPNFAMDAKCFLGTIGSVLTSDGVVEGGTGQMAEEEQTLTEEQQDALVPPEKLEREVQIGAAVTGAAAAASLAGVAALAHHFARGEKKEKPAKVHKSLALPIATSAVVAGIGACAVYDQMKKRKLDATSQTKGEGAERIERAEPKEPETLATPDRPIRVLITGANSYVGTHVEQWLAQWPDRFEVDTIDMQDPSWREHDFSGYDTVYHVAGIAHADVGSVTDEQKAAYYAVNTDLAIECAQRAKDAGVSQFILMSSMIVYGGKDWIDASTEPAPVNFYGDSKWRADQGVRALADDNFKVAVLRPPMIYGRGSKGNYPQLAKLATKLPAFPQVRNRRSMLHIDNLCEFVRLIIEDRAEGVFFPQNAEHVCTSDMVRAIAKVRGHRIVMVPGMSFPADLMGKVPGKVGGLASKAFGDSAYDLALSDYPRNYRVRTFEESIRLTEGDDTGGNQGDKGGERCPEEGARPFESERPRGGKLKILVVTQYYWPEQFQVTEVCEALAERGYAVTVLTGLPNYPEGDVYEGYRRGENREQVHNGVRILRVPMIPRGHNPAQLALNYHSFAASGCAAVRELPGDFDVVYVPEVSPVTMVDPAALYKKLHKTPLLVYCMDLWPESLKTVLGNKGGAIVQLYKGLSKRLYAAADLVAVQSPAFMDYLEDVHGIPRERMRYFPQFADEAYLDMDLDEPHEGVNFTVAGNMGRAQDIPVILRAIELMRHKDGFTLTFIGDGSCYEETRTYVADRGLGDRVKLLGRKPYDEMPGYYAKTDAFILALNGDSMVGTTIPSRLQGYMAVGKPVFAAVNGGAASVIAESKAGRAASAGDSEGLAALLDEYLDGPDRFKNCGASAREYFAAHFTKQKYLYDLESMLQDLGGNKA